jgi:protein-tyrosine phosphatase
VIDLHTHLLPAVDDGSPTLENSVHVLQRFASDGVRIVACTPHLRASQAASAPVDAHGRLLDALRAAAPESIEVRSGWEILLDRAGCDLRRQELSLGGSRAVLVEFIQGRLPKGATEELMRLRASGVRPVLAHVERYRGCTADAVRVWRRMGVAIQSDATILLTNTEQADLAKSLLELGLVDVLASDNHGDLRTLATARRWLEELGAREQAIALTETNPAGLLHDEELVPVPPIRFETGVFARLRELVRRARGGSA